MSERFQKHFVTDHLVADLKGRSVRGGAVTLTAQVIKFVLQMGSTMVLARLLLPSDFGLIAMVTAIIGFVAMFKDAGLSMATVQRKDVTHEQVSTLFWINVSLSAAVMLLVAALAPAIAAFYSEPRLVWVTLALAGTMLFGGFTVQHQALLRRQMRFKALAVIEIASMAGGVGVAIAMALMDLGYWSLVGMTAATALTNAVLVWLLCDWRPGSPRRHSGVGEMVKFGGGLSLASLLSYAREQGPFIMIGWVFGPGLLAVYERAYRLLVLPLKQMMPPVSAVAIPVLSRLQEDEARFRSTARKLLYVAALCSIFPSAIAVVIAPELIQIFLGNQWKRSAIIFACLVPLAATQAVSAVMVWCITSTGRSLALVRFGFANASIALLTVGAGATYGIEWAAAAFSCGGVFIRTPLLYLTVIRNTPITSKDLLGETWIFFATGTLVSTVGLILRLKFVGFEHVSFGWMVAWSTGSALFFVAVMHQLRSFDRIHQLIGTRQP
ncbi:MAG: lipopolysaccharide biosynthesis protein [Phycisphaerales bacterium]